jgi:hypothetical protein
MILFGGDEHPLVIEQREYVFGPFIRDELG